MSSKVLTLNGVPYSVNLSTGEVSFYGLSTPMTLGTLSADKSSVTLTKDWETKAKPVLEAYRQTLKKATEEAMRKATEFAGKN